MSAADQTITIPAITPATPIVLADATFTSTLAKVALEIAHLKVTDDVSAQSAANYLQRLTKAATALESARKTVKSPFLSKCQEIDAAAAKPAADIEQLKASVKKMLASYEALQRARAAEEEAKRQAEILRLQKLRDEEVRIQKEREAALALQAAATAKRSFFHAAVAECPTVLVNGHTLSFKEDGPRLLWIDLAATPNATDWAVATPEVRQKIEEARGTLTTPPPADDTLDFGFDEPPAPEPPTKTDVQKQLEAVVHAVAPVESKPNGVAFRERLLVRVTNVADLPEPFIILQPNERKLREVYCLGWQNGQPIPEVPGCSFEVERMPVSTGRAVF